MKDVGVVVAFLALGVWLLILMEDDQSRATISLEAHGSVRHRPPETAEPLQGEHPARVEIPSEVVVSALIEKVEEWKNYAIELEKKLPQARLARLVNLTQADVQVHLDRSLIISNDTQLQEALGLMQPQDIVEAWKLESAYYKELSKLRAKVSSDADRYVRQAHHDSVVVPFINERVTALCSRLYELCVPTSGVESFRTRALEDI